MRQVWMAPVAWAESTGPSLSNSSTPTSILPAGMAKWICRGQVLDVGTTIEGVGLCQCSNIVTSAGTLTLDVKMGGTVVMSSGAMNFSTTAHTALPLFFKFFMTCQTIGSATAATFKGWWEVASQCLSLTSIADQGSTIPLLIGPNTTPAAGNGFDSTVDNTMDVYATFSNAQTGNAIQLHCYRAVLIN